MPRPCRAVPTAALVAVLAVVLVGAAVGPAAPASAGVPLPVAYRWAVPVVRSAPGGGTVAIPGAATAGGRATGPLTLVVERSVNRGPWQHASTIRTSATGTFTLRVRASAPAVLHWRVRNAATGSYAASVSAGVKHESRHDPADPAQWARMVAAARASGADVGVGLVDRATGRSYGWSQGRTTFYTASMAKVLVAMDVLRSEQVAGRSTPSTASAGRIIRMVRYSDDSVTWDYWRARGGTAVVARVNRLCGTTIAVDAGIWSRTRPTPVQLAQVLDCLADGRAVGAPLSGWLLYQMRHVTASQRWGVPAADPDPFRAEAGKNGWWRWPCCYYWSVGSMALFGPRYRYALVVMTQYGGARPQSVGERAAYGVTRALFPPGTIVE